MAGSNIALIGLLHLALVTQYVLAARNTHLSCTSSHSGDFVILDCYYNGGLPFPTLTWTGPRDLYRETKNTPRFTINITREQFVDEWDTIYKCIAGHRYLSSYCYIGRGIGSYVGIAFGALALLFLFCILLICICVGCQKLCERIERNRGNDEKPPGVVTTGHNNPSYTSETEQDAKAPE